ncbi:uncharacterized protein LOC106874765 [Octopus bimaculoides]|uniref:CUB domain-containing protein n=1 Tax=Octopus bimaculoides TaxID=37653 RepID=A0A0L8GTH7_OCTBM|nr:uncharacterized protein LOC106874765 [Octopus bimaculoides]XP_014778101.1 uncharacterized protein LOC106874765 [Octopus bimaculoides]XP_014778102.1 uncharacterized protein LOC106874765 [Octopus bimaculoides]XP_052830915.1 uncharacterized protein LOC106874765 [Octopus bimaculoides]XP_052830916.1 uncharacterized protein LOC106874765 [Octopus bimaculoides]|eukprot:XP_014778100.1 PREDICTED: uncharacterized protein LOC106874765 [Octopus bimaculoides]
MTKLLKSCTWKIVSFFVLLHPIAICGIETTIKETTAINNSTTSLDAAYDISKLSQSKYVAQTPYIQNYSIAYAGQCGDYFLVPPNCTYEVSVNFGIHEQDLGNLYCVLTFLALGGSRRKFCLNVTKIHLTEDMDIYVFEGENMEYPELYQHIIRHLTNKEGPQIFCTNTNTLSVRFEYPILKGSLSPDVEFKVIPTDDVVLMKGNDCFKNFEMDNQSYYRVVTWPDSTDHHASWGGCFLTFVRESSGTMCVQFLNFYIGKDSNDVSLTFLVGDNIPMMSLNVNSSFPNATFCTPTKLLFVELRQKVTFVKQLRDYNFVFLVTAETLENGSQTSWSVSTLLLISVAVILNFYLNGCEER